jgi:hypothetical protein
MVDDQEIIAAAMRATGNDPAPRTVFARDRNRLGSVPGFDKPWSHFLALLRDLTQGL